MKIRAFVILLALFSGLTAFAGITTYTGRTPAIWDSHAVVYGEITEVLPDKQGRDHADIKLDVQATLAGSFDAAKDATISAPVEFSREVDAVEEAPRAKTKVVAFLCRQKDGHYAVERNFASFMPHSSPLVVVENFEDAKVKEIISKLRAAWKYARDTKDKKKDWWEE